MKKEPNEDASTLKYWNALATFNRDFAATTSIGGGFENITSLRTLHFRQDLSAVSIGFHL